MEKDYTSRVLTGHASLADDIVEDAQGILDRLKDRAPSEGELLGIKAVAQNIARGVRAIAEMHCPGHVASPGNSKICGRCGVHVDTFRPDEPDGP